MRACSSPIHPNDDVILKVSIGGAISLGTEVKHDPQSTPIHDVDLCSSFDVQMPRIVIASCDDELHIDCSVLCREESVPFSSEDHQLIDEGLPPLAESSDGKRVVFKPQWIQVSRGTLLQPLLPL